MSDIQSLILKFVSLGSSDMERALDAVTVKGARAERTLITLEEATKRAAAALRTNTRNAEAQVAVWSNPAFERITEKYRNLRVELAQLQAPTRTLANETEKYTVKIENQILALKAQAAALSNVGGKMQQAELAGLTGGVKQLTHPLSYGPNQPVANISEAEKLADAYLRQNAQLRTRLDFLRDPANAKAIEQQAALRAELDALSNKTMPGLLGGMSAWHKAMIGIGAAFAIMSVTASLVEATTMYDKLNTRLVALDGNVIVTSHNLAKLQALARQPGIGLEQASKGYIALRALNETGTESIRVLSGIARANAVMGGTQVEFGRAMVQIQQMIGKGKVMGEDIRTLSNSIPNFRGLMLSAFGSVDTKIINSKYTVDQFLEGIVGAAERLKTPSNTIANDLDNIGDGWVRLKANILDTQFLKTATGLLDKVLQKYNDTEDRIKAENSFNDRLDASIIAGTGVGFYNNLSAGTGNYLDLEHKSITARWTAIQKSYEEGLVAVAALNEQKLKDAEKAAQAQAKLESDAEDERIRAQKEAAREAKALAKEQAKNRMDMILENLKAENAEKKAYFKQAHAEETKWIADAQADVARVEREVRKEATPREAVEVRYRERTESLDKVYGPKSGVGAPTEAAIQAYMNVDTARQVELDKIGVSEAKEREQLMKHLKTEEELIAASYALRREEIMASMVLTEADKRTLLKKNEELQLQEERTAQMKRTTMIASASADLSMAIADSFKLAQGEQSKAYKAMFITSKAFLIADASLKIFNAGAEAMRLPWPANAPAMAMVAAQGATIIGNMNAIAGLFDAGGMIPAGRKGIVGEYGPELVEGPAIVTSRRQTASQLGSSSLNVQVHNYTSSDVSVSEVPGSDGKDFEIIVGALINRAEKHLATSVSMGAGPLNTAITRTFGLQRGG